MNDKRFIHLTWAISFFLVVLIICSSLLWINHNSWTLRFEMDNNTREAIESIEYPIANINEIESQAGHNYSGNPFSPDIITIKGACSLMNCTASQFNTTCVDYMTGENCDVNVATGEGVKE